MPVTTETPAPSVIPVFPLTGSLLLPGTLLPLNIFEPRYRHLVADALSQEEEGKHIGMIQPIVPRLDNFGPMEPLLLEEIPKLYSVGCVGRIERSQQQPDGRYEIVLRGICRFRVREELPEQRGYRRVSADYGEFLRDVMEPQVSLDPSRMLGALRAFGEAHSLEFDFGLLGSLPGISLLNGLAVALPFRPEEKQALLEAAGPMEREQLLLALMGMGLEPLSTDEYYAPPTVH
ncbi:MAG TPA: LON peptidase substrate-binding domain-containing protein [Thermoanaerobaculia bacterium]|nr:LON peptidase substrate-binding domain-containing protein [Thermoanaerobaculia bacterium]